MSKKPAVRGLLTSCDEYSLIVALIGWEASGYITGLYIHFPANREFFSEPALWLPFDTKVAPIFQQQPRTIRLLNRENS